MEYAGSSPHTRGPRQEHPLSFDGRRFIPAYAGSTKPESAKRKIHRVHPRIRGVHPGWMGSPSGGRGSSPHTRGPLQQVGVSIGGPGFIPAYAGSTINFSLLVSGVEVHPRIRGVHLSLMGAVHFNTGSSPHTRGPPLGLSGMPVDGRFIPAYAGSTGL